MQGKGLIHTIIADWYNQDKAVHWSITFPKAQIIRLIMLLFRYAMPCSVIGMFLCVCVWLIPPPGNNQYHFMFEAQHLVET